MKQDVKISTGLEGLDRSIDFLHPGDTVVWQTEHTADYIYMTNRFVTSVARSGKRIIYIRFGSNAEAIDADALAKAGANVRKYNVDPSVGFETFAVSVYRIIKSEQDNAFYIFDSLSELQNHWFSDMLICDFFCLTYPELKAHGAVAYIPIRYQRHTYETVSRIRNTTPVLINVRTVDGNLYIHPVKVNGRHTETMFLPLKVSPSGCELITSSADSYAIFDIFTQTGERRDCWDTMFDSVASGGDDPTDPDGVRIKENIMRCLLGIEPTRLGLCRNYFSTADLMDIKKREIGTGCIGGKAAGMLLARNILKKTDTDFYNSRIEPHDSYFIGADVFYTYGVENNLWQYRTEMEKEEDYIRVSPMIRDLLLNGTFRQSIKDQFISMLEYFGQSPIIVRSSSLLEDGFGNAFAGKYESVFCPNQGNLEERYAEFESAVKTVYASTVNPDAIRYRAQRNLLNRDEQMALLVMRVCGDIHGRYYFPHIAGVGHSKNLYVNGAVNDENNKGMLRLVFGMGTRAVDREADDYARLLNMADPLAPQLIEHGDEYKYSQHKADVIDIKENRFCTVKIDSLDKNDLKADPWLFMEPDLAALNRFREAGLFNVKAPDIMNFNRLLKKTSFAGDMTHIMQLLADKYSYPVDIEFACNFRKSGDYRINLLQCRPLQSGGVGYAAKRPEAKKMIFQINGNFMGGNICEMPGYIVFVDVESYLSLPEQKKYAVARRIGELNTLLKDKRAVLMGPGRWGTTTPSLGVPVHFMEINNYFCISELAYNSHGLRPELSYGSHFFQDLVEAETFYTAIYPGEAGSVFDEELLRSLPECTDIILGKPADDLNIVVRVYDLNGLNAVLYSEITSSECFLALT